MADSAFHPIVLIRGFAGRRDDIKAAANQAFLGFEEGFTGRWPTTKDDGNRIGFAQWFFESVVVRLQSEHGYRDAYVNNGWASRKDDIGQRSIWPFRYYDLASEQFGDGERHFITRYAKELRRFILSIREAVCETDDEKTAFRVNLVTHSQGGLVARAYLQNVCRGVDPDLIGDEAEALELSPQGGDNLVNRVFNYGTPHNGIELFGINSLLDPFGGMIGADVFDRKTIKRYLGIPKDGSARSLNGAFPPQDMFNLIGSDWSKYDIKVSSWATKGESDGLVKMSNAWTEHSPRATVHKAHGGPDGLVNSEEGYQNLQRFLFGDWRADIMLDVQDYDLPAPFSGRTLTEPGNMEDALMLADVELDVRGGLVPLHERTINQESAIPLLARHLDGDGHSAHLASTFLWSRKSDEESAAGPGRIMRFNLDLDVRFSASQDRIGPDFRIRGKRLLAASLVVDIDAATDDINSVRYDDGEDSSPGLTTATELTADRDGARLFAIPIGSSSAESGWIKGRVLMRLRPHG